MLSRFFSVILILYGLSACEPANHQKSHLNEFELRKRYNPKSDYQLADQDLKLLTKK